MFAFRLKPISDLEILVRPILSFCIPSSLIVSFKTVMKAGVPHAIFTHCGSEIIKDDERILWGEANIRNMARESGFEAEIAHDGKEVILR